MLIISPFRDYYDGAAGTLGVDKTVVYERETREVEEVHQGKSRKHDKKDVPRPFVLKMTWFSGMPTLSPRDGVRYHVGGFVVGFCGRTYVGFKVFGMSEQEVKTRFLYDPDTASTFFPAKRWGDDRARVRAWFEAFHDKPLSPDLFRKYGTPVFVQEENMFDDRFVVNPRLGDYEFFKVVGVPRAFQEISMYLSVLGSREKDTSEVPDKFRIAQRGFDKWSFRNPDPPKRKQK